jgi:RimJ/RimL family protein N-acetyltransferase
MGVLTELRDQELELKVAGDLQFSLHLDGVDESVGGIELRLKPNRYGGQVGYAVGEAYRGRGLASRALRLLLPLAREHDIQRLWIACDPGNLASRRTCEKVGFRLQEIVDLPPEHELYLRGERQRCRYVLILGEDRTPEHS